MIGIVGALGKMKIQLKGGENLVKKRLYRLYPQYKEKVLKELECMLDGWIIFLVEKSDWVNLMVVQDKKEGEIHIYVDLHNLNATCIHDLFPTPFTYEVLGNVRG